MASPHSWMTFVASYRLFSAAYLADLLKCVPSYKKYTLFCMPTSVDPGRLFPVSFLKLDWIPRT